MLSGIPGLSNLNIIFSTPRLLFVSFKDSPCNRNSTSVPAKAGIKDAYNQNGDRTVRQSARVVESQSQLLAFPKVHDPFKQKWKACFYV